MSRETENIQLKDPNTERHLDGYENWDSFFPPLKNPLENRLSVYRVVRYLGLSFNPVQYSFVQQLIFKSYNGIITERVKQGRVFGRSKKNKTVPVYPLSFLEEMISIIKEYHKKVNRVKRKRIVR